MADISKIKLPSGNIYNIKDQQARDAIAALQGGSYFLGKSTTPLADGSTTNPISIEGEASPVTAVNGNVAVYGNAEFIFNGTKWIEFGDLSTLGDLATKDSVTLNKGAGDQVLGADTNITAASSAVSFSGGSTDKVLGSGATFNTQVTPSKTRIKATASGAAVGADGTETFVKSYPGATSKLATTSIPNVTGNTPVSIPNVTNAGAASTWGFAMGNGDDAETLVISGANGSAPTLGTALSASKVTLGTAITAATGSLAANGSGASVMTGLGTPSTAAALTGVKVTAQPAIALATGASAAAGVVEVATGIENATTEVDDKDEVTAVTGIGTATAAAQQITVGTNDRVKVAKFDDLSVSVS